MCALFLLIGITPLMWAANQGNLMIVTVLIDHGAIVNDKSNNGKY